MLVPFLFISVAFLTPVVYNESVRKYLPVLALVLTFVAFSGGLSAGFLNWDDGPHFFENPDVLHFSFLTFFEPFLHLINKIYLPLATLSFAIEYKLFGADPFVAHLINLLLHLGNVFLIFLLARRMGLKDVAAFVAALLFGIHPMHVESVMWVTERKDVLYSLFYLLSLLCYWEYLGGRRVRHRSLSLMFFVLSMLAKPMALSLPLVFILLDWFSQRELNGKVFLEKIPFLAVAVLIGGVSYWFNARVSVADLGQAPLVWAWSASFYVIKFFLPLFLSPLYYLPEPVNWANPEYLVSAVVVAALAVGLVFWRNRWFKFAVFFYVLSVFFLWRFDATADKSIVADRFMYLPSLGFCLGAGALAEWAFYRRAGKLIGVGISVVFLFLAVRTYRQCAIWEHSLTVWNTVVSYYPHEAKGYSYRANAYIKKGNYKAAMEDLNRALQLDPEEHTAYHQKGWIYFQRGRVKDSLEAFNACLTIKPDYVLALNARGVVYAKTGRLSEAIADFSRALEIAPRNEEVLSNFMRAREDLLVLKGKK